MRTVGLLGPVIPKCLLVPDPSSGVAAVETGCALGRKQQPAKSQAAPLKFLRGSVMSVLSLTTSQSMLWAEPKVREKGVGWGGRRGGV